MCDWGAKYKVEGGIAFSPEEVAKYGKQVLDVSQAFRSSTVGYLDVLSALGYVVFV